MKWFNLIVKFFNFFKKSESFVNSFKSNKSSVLKSNSYPQRIEEYLRAFMFIKEIKPNNEMVIKRGIKSLQFELLYNPELSKINYTGKLDGERTHVLREALKKMWDCSDIPRITKVDNPSEANSKIREIIENKLKSSFPKPLVLAVLEQESNLMWYRKDGYPTIGLDYNNKVQPYVITSRGLFLSQRTVFDYPFKQEQLNQYDSVEVDLNFVVDLLNLKYDKFIVSKDPKTNDDLRSSSFGSEDLRGCKYETSDSRYKSDCKNCVWSGDLRDYKKDRSVLGDKKQWVLKSSQYHKIKQYLQFPDYSKFPCDYLFSIRRYNGSGINSFHYLMRVLKHLKKNN